MRRGRRAILGILVGLLAVVLLVAEQAYAARFLWFSDDFFNTGVRRFDLDMNVLNNPLYPANLDNGFAWDPVAGVMYQGAGLVNSVLNKRDINGNLLQVIGTNFSFQHPEDGAFNAADGTLWRLEAFSNTLHHYTTGGALIGDLNVTYPDGNSTGFAGGGGIEFKNGVLHKLHRNGVGVSELGTVDMNTGVFTPTLVLGFNVGGGPFSLTYEDATDTWYHGGLGFGGVGRFNSAGQNLGAILTQFQLLHSIEFAGDRVPMPATLLLFGAGLAGLGGLAWRRRRRQ